MSVATAQPSSLDAGMDHDGTAGPAASTEPGIVVDGVDKVYLPLSHPARRMVDLLRRRRHRTEEGHRALNAVSLSVPRGTTLGIVGRNGSGKSTLLQIICGTLKPTSGRVLVNGRLSALLELGSGFNPEFTGRENVYLNGAILGRTKAEIDAFMADVEAFADIGAAIDAPTKTYSTGMVMRLAFAAAVAVQPDILVVDEALAVGDELFQRRCLARIDEMKRNGATILFVSHSAGQVVEICDRVVVLDRGDVLFDGAPRKALNVYHRLIYTAADRQAAYRDLLRAAYLRGEAPPPPPDPVGGRALKADREADDPDQADFFNPGLVVDETTIYEPRGARIENLHVRALDGRRVNVLVGGRAYEVVYRVRFLDDCWAIAFGTRIKTVTGLELGGASTGQAGEFMEHVVAGQIVEVVHRFDCRLLPGTYFLNAGVSGLIDGARTALHRLVDGVAVQIQPAPAGHSNGPVDFGFRSAVRQIEPNGR